MNFRFSKTAILVAVLVTLAFVAIVARWVIVMNLAEDVDTHRLTAEEEIALLVKRTQRTNERSATP